MLARARLNEMPSISRQIWEEKYRLQDQAGAGEATLEESFTRVANAVAAPEGPEQRSYWAKAFLEIMADLRFLPAGRILAGAGSNRAVTLFNCFVMGKLDDSIPGIFNGLKEAALTLQQGGGIGHDFSTLRPKGAKVLGVGADASGPLSFMDVWDAMCRTIMSAGARRGAMMGTLRCDHPDIEDFIAAKQDARRLRNFNVSVLVTDAFMVAVKAKAEWPLVFGGKVYKTVSAEALWQKLMRSTYDYAEPGVIFIDRINAKNPLSYIEQISCTNPCGEQPLPAYGACLLGSLNLTRFVLDAFSSNARLDEVGLRQTTATAIRLLDNVIDVSRYPLPEQHSEALRKRRLGLGLTGLGDALLMCGLRYDSAEAATWTARCMTHIRHAALEASAKLGAEKGSFALFDVDAYLATAYGQGLPTDLQNLIRTHGLRNGLLTSIAPTGTISLLAGNVSSGIEPIFNTGYERHITNADGSKRAEWLEDYAVAAWRSKYGHTSLPLNLVTVEDLTPEDHLVMAAAIQPFVDSSISKTVNVRQDLKFENFVSVYEKAYALGLKGCTTFRPNEVTGSILQVAPRGAETCPSCGSADLVAKEGCKSCSSCGYALCG